MIALTVHLGVPQLPLKLPLYERLLLQVEGVVHSLIREQVMVETVDDQLALVVGDLARVRVSAGADARALAADRVHAGRLIGGLAAQREPEEQYGRKRGA